MLKSFCARCGITKSKFESQNGSGLSDKLAYAGLKAFG